MAAKHKIALIASAALVVVALWTTTAAQPYGPGSVFMGPGMMGPGMMGPRTGGWMMGRRGFGGM
jgi:hypothetical protein